MHLAMWGRRPVCLLALALALSASLPARAGGDGDSAVDFTRGFLQKYPRFQAEGVMTSTLVGKPPYHCKIEVTFNKTSSVLFAYNTDASKNIIPYDYAYADHALKETVYNRERTQVLHSEEIGAPTRTVFNFVWNLLYEAEHGAGFNSLLANGLMSITREDSGHGTRILLHRRIPTGPVEKVRFQFDDEGRLKNIEITQGDGSVHKIEFRKFRADPVEVKDDDKAPHPPAAVGAPAPRPH